MEYLTKFGAKSGGVALLIFGIYGFFVNLFIGSIWGFSEPLSDDTMAAATGPLSVVTFALFMLSALVFVAIVTRLGTRPVDLSDKTKLFMRFTVRVVEATVVMGLGIIGALVGLAISAHFLDTIQWVSVSPHPILYALAAMIFAITFPFVVLIISLFDHSRTYRMTLNIASGVYVLFVVGLFVLAGLYEAVAYLGVVMSGFLIAQSVRTRFATEV
ncbi:MULTISPECIES: hypothetical protein [Vibrio]|uniref:hypothetical protein n=1 Tax=Vibrio TaxID=662 RepID=UPI00034DC9AD|nr:MULTISPECIES: hypothetical protein [Vibrio]MDA0126370.1 hypothetical protein [Vibrio sp. MM46]GEA20032.1 hypothetical protein VH1807_contig00001-0115 [Vibrio harveyi]HCE5295657.1 hypothetical protein [Vibrio parahaemolyticus]